ncbi:MAG: hypothetical protein ACJ740_16225 [Gaiellales bacterium]|jgi:hypothetical protein
MIATVWNLVRAATGLENGRECRSCNESIRREDPFGMSEGVCRPCRSA